MRTIATHACSSLLKHSLLCHNNNMRSLLFTWWTAPVAAMISFHDNWSEGINNFRSEGTEGCMQFSVWRQHCYATTTICGRYYLPGGSCSCSRQINIMISWQPVWRLHRVLCQLTRVNGGPRKKLKMPKVVIPNLTRVAQKIENSKKLSSPTWTPVSALYST